MFAVGATLASGVFQSLRRLRSLGSLSAGSPHRMGHKRSWDAHAHIMFFQAQRSQARSSSGLYSYAKTGFGEYMGFNSAWGFWLSALLGNLSFITLFFCFTGKFLSHIRKRH